MIGPVPEFCIDCSHRFNCVMFEPDPIDPHIFKGTVPLVETIKSHNRNKRRVRCVKISVQKGWEYTKKFNKLYCDEVFKEINKL